MKPCKDDRIKIKKGFKADPYYVYVYVFVC